MSQSLDAKQEEVLMEVVGDPVRPHDPFRYGQSLPDSEAYSTILAWDTVTRRAKERSLVRRLDLIVCFPLVMMYITNYLDRNSIAQARLTGLVQATGISDNDYATVNGIFYVSYIIGQTPANMLLSKARPSRFFVGFLWGRIDFKPAVMILWAIVSACTAVCTSFGHLIAVRFVLGFCEAPFYPGAVFYLSSWYTRKEIGKRISILVSGICLSNAFAGLISAGIISGLNGAHGIGGWQWIFIVEGALTVGLALIVALIIPDYPGTTKFLSPENRVLAQLRLDEDIGLPDTNEVGVFRGLKMAAKDYRTWCFGMLQWSITIMIGFNFFYPTLVQGMGFTNNTQILLLTVPPYFVAFVASFGMSWSADRTQKRAFHFGICVAVTSVGLILLIGLASTTQQGATYFSTFILAAGSFAAYSCSYPWLASVMPRPATKRASAIAIANSMSNIGAFLSGYIYIASFGPKYRVSWSITLGFAALVAAIVAYLYMRMTKRNKKLDFVEHEYTGGRISDAELESMDVDEVLAAKSGFRLAT